MKVVILAAGMGTRFRPMTEHLPKCLIEIHGKTLLEYSLENLLFHGIKDVIIVTGHMENEIKSKFGENYKGIKIQYVRNERFSETGSMYSLSCAKDMICEDILLLESDLLYEKSAIACLLESEQPNTILTSRLINNGDDVFVCVDGNNQVINLGKKIPDNQKPMIKGCLVGISRLSHVFLQKLFDTAEKDYQAGELNYHYEECILKTSLAYTPVFPVHFNDLIWTEIDNENDFKHANEVIWSKIYNLATLYPVKRNILLNPGPATTTDTVKFAQVVPDICPREKIFGDLMKSISSDINKISGGGADYTTVLFGGSGTSAMDAVINSVIPKDESILIINNGAYGERMVEIARAYSIPIIELKYEWDELPKLEEIEAALQENPNIHAVSMVHHETTSGLLNPIEKIGKIVKKHQKIFIVDTISSFAGIPFGVKECGIDFMMSTSNKCLQGMAGISFVICHNEALDSIKDYPRRSYYLSLYDQYIYFIKNHQMRFTPPVQTVYALRQALDEFLEEGLEQRYARYTENWKVLRSGLIKLGYKIMTEPENESHILITVNYPENPLFDFDLLHNKLYEKGFTIYPGKIGKKNTFRIANMGAINSQDIKVFLDELEDISELWLQMSRKL